MGEIYGDNATSIGNTPLVELKRVTQGARLGAASLVIHDVPAKAVAVGVPARVNLGSSGRETHNKLPDPASEALPFLQKEIIDLDRKLEKLAEKAEREKEDLHPVGKFTRRGGI